MCQYERAVEGGAVRTSITGTIGNTTSIIDTADVGRCVRAARKAQGLTQKELAGFFTAFSREFLSDLENGKPTVELGRALAVLNSLGLRVSITSCDDQQGQAIP